MAVGGDSMAVLLCSMVHQGDSMAPYDRNILLQYDSMAVTGLKMIP